MSALQKSQVGDMSRPTMDTLPHPEFEEAKVCSDAQGETR